MVDKACVAYGSGARNITISVVANSLPSVYRLHIAQHFCLFSAYSSGMYTSASELTIFKLSDPFCTKVGRP